MTRNVTPDQQSRIRLLFSFHNLSAATIAKRMGLTYQQVHRVLHIKDGVDLQAAESKRRALTGTSNIKSHRGRVKPLEDVAFY